MMNETQIEGLLMEAADPSKDANRKLRAYVGGVADLVEFGSSRAMELLQRDDLQSALGVGGNYATAVITFGNAWQAVKKQCQTRDWPFPPSFS